MSFVYVTLLNVILLFIVYVVLNHKINKNSTSALLDRYAREVENLIVELNRAVDDVLGISEERIGELKKLLRKTERLLGGKEAGRFLEAAEPPDGRVAGGSVRAARMGPGADGPRADGPRALPLYDERGEAVEIGTSEVTSRTKEAAGSGPAGSGPAGSGPAGSGSSGPRSSRPGYAKKTERSGGAPAPQLQDGSQSVNLLERTKHLLAMGHTKEEIAKSLGISRAEMDFLASLQNK